MKKSVVFFSLIAIVSAALWTVHTFSQETSRVYESAEYPYVEHIKEVLTKLSENIDMGTSHNLDGFFSSDVSAFLKGKIEITQYVTKLNDTEKTKYNAEVILLEEQPVGRDIYLKYQIITTFYYLDVFDENILFSDDYARNTKTTRGFVVEVIYSKEINKILDIYSELNYYDIAVRGKNINIKNERYSISAENLTERIKELRNNLYRVYLEERGGMDLSSQYHTLGGYSLHLFC